MKFLTFHILGMSSSQLTFAPSFFRGVGLNHQPDKDFCFWKYHVLVASKPFLKIGIGQLRSQIWGPTLDAKH